MQVILRFVIGRISADQRKKKRQAAGVRKKVLHNPLVLIAPKFDLMQLESGATRPNEAKAPPKERRNPRQRACKRLQVILHFNTPEIKSQVHSGIMQKTGAPPSRSAVQPIRTNDTPVSFYRTETACMRSDFCREFTAMPEHMQFVL